MTDTDDELETRVERLERLVGVEDVLPTSRRQYLTGIAGLSAGALIGHSGARTVTADSHGQGVLGSPESRVNAIHVQHDYGTTLDPDVIDGPVTDAPVTSLSGDVYFGTDGPQFDGDVLLQPAENVLYDEGDGESDWVPGYSDNDGAQQKQADNLNITTFDTNQTAERTWVTDSTVDMSQHSAIEIEWEQEIADSDFHASYLVISQTQSGDHETDVQASLSRVFETFGRETQVVDVSDVTTESYVRVHGRGSWDGQTSVRLSVYGVRML